MKKKIIYLSIIILSVVIIVVYSCSSKSGVQPVAPPVVTANTVSIKNFAFSPASLTVKAGTTVTWTNVDTAPHTVTDLNGTFDSGSLATNATFSQKFSTAGTFTYHCSIHAMMANATIVVQ